MRIRIFDSSCHRPIIWRCHYRFLAIILNCLTQRNGEGKGVDGENNFKWSFERWKGIIQYNWLYLRQDIE